MATVLRTAYVNVLPKTDNFDSDLAKKLRRVDGNRIGGSIGQSIGSGMRVGISGSLRNMAGLMAGAFAAVKGVQVFGSFITEARESEKISRITANAIRATGGVANVTAGQVGQLATALSNKTAVDDELVQSGANLLLTFKNIRNEAGAGNDIFNQATAAALDLSAAGFGSVEGASKTLGKALNDPIKGISALGRAGVTFTQQQKDQIKTLVESGDVLGAQRIIMEEIQGQVGGAAAAAADPMERLRVVAGNLKEQIGGALLPMVERLATWFGEKAAPAIGVLFDALTGRSEVGEFEGFLGFINDVGANAYDIFRRLSEGARIFFDALTGKSEINEFDGTLKTINNLGIHAGEIIRDVARGIKVFFDAFTGNSELNEFEGGLRTVNNVGIELGEWFRNELVPALKDFARFIKDEVVPRLRDIAIWIGENVLPLIIDFAQWITRNREFVGGLVVALLGAFAALKTLMFIKTVTQAVMAFNAMLLANPIGIVVAAIGALVAGLIYAYKNSETFRDIVNGVWHSVKAAVEAVVRWIANTALPWLLDAYESIKNGITAVRDFFATAWQTIKDVVREGIRVVVDFFLGMAESILGAAETAFGWIPGLGDKLRTARDNFSTFRDAVNIALGGINDKTVSIRAQLDEGAAYLAKTRGLNESEAQALARKLFADGGPVFGPGGPRDDRIPAMLSNNEHVWTAEEVRKAGGHAAVERMRQQVRGYADGGAVRRGLNVRTELPATDNLAEVARAINEGADRMFASGARSMAMLEKAVNARAREAQVMTLPAGLAPAVAPGTGAWRRPLTGYRVSSEFGMRGGRLHTGIDLAAPTGSSIFAAAAGRVSRAQSLTTSYGKHVVLDHGGGLQTLYAHMSQLGAAFGQMVAVGQRIGLVGSTGNSTGPHLHYETRPGGRPVNPRPFMAARGVTFDDGGWIMPGWNPPSFNGTGQAERVIAPHQRLSLDDETIGRLATALARAGRDVNITVNPREEVEADLLVRRLDFAFRTGGLGE